MVITDANMSIVSSAAPVLFRRFLPHERQVVRPVAHRDDLENILEEIAVPVTTGLPGGLLSSEDISVLFDAAEQTKENWGYPTEQADELYLPFTFALAARS